MSRRFWRTVVLLSSLLAGLAVAQPTLAYTELGHTGTVGAHSLTDTSSNNGAVCRYAYWSSESVWKLKRIFVNPPNMKAIVGAGTEPVGWNFTVQRREGGFGGFGAWHATYVSPVWRTTTDSSHNATFSEESVRVNLPFAPGADAAAEYRVNVKLFWFKPDGTHVRGTATERINFYRVAEGVDSAFTRHNLCFDYEV